MTDVEASSRWHQQLPCCQSAHGGSEYERPEYNGRLVRQLHSFEVDHDHEPIGNSEDKPYGSGVLLWLEVDDFDEALARAAETQAEVVMPRHRNPATGKVVRKQRSAQAIGLVRDRLRRKEMISRLKARP